MALPNKFDNGSGLTQVQYSDVGGTIPSSVLTGPRPIYGSWTYRKVILNQTPASINAGTVGPQYWNNNSAAWSTYYGPFSTEGTAVVLATAAGASSQAWMQNDTSQGSGTQTTGTFGTMQCLQMRVQLTATTNIRCWIGTTHTSLAGSAATFKADAPAAEYAAFRFSTNAGDTHWQAVLASDGTHQTVVDTGITPNITSSHTFTILQSNNVYTYYIDGNLVATISTNLPLVQDTREFFISVDNVGVAVIRSCNIQWAYTEENV